LNQRGAAVVVIDLEGVFIDAQAKASKQSRFYLLFEKLNV